MELAHEHDFDRNGLVFWLGSKKEVWSLHHLYTATTHCHYTHTATTHTAHPLPSSQQLPCQSSSTPPHCPGCHRPHPLIMTPNQNDMWSNPAMLNTTLHPSPSTLALQNEMWSNPALFDITPSRNNDVVATYNMDPTTSCNGDIGTRTWGTHERAFAWTPQGGLHWVVACGRAWDGHSVGGRLHRGR